MLPESMTALNLGSIIILFLHSNNIARHQNTQPDIMLMFFHHVNITVVQFTADNFFENMHKPENYLFSPDVCVTIRVDVEVMTIDT